MAFSNLEEAFGGPFPDGKTFRFGQQKLAADSEQPFNKNRVGEAARGGAEQLGLPGLEAGTTVVAECKDGNGAQAPKKYGSLVAEADAAVRRIDAIAQEAFGAAEDRFSPGLPGVQAALYSAIASLEEQGRLDEFLVDRGIRRHGNVKNQYTPVVQAFAKRRHLRVRQVLAKTAALIALARADSVAPENFGTWRKDWPIEEACRAWRERQAHVGDVDEPKMAVDFFLATDAEFLPAAASASGYAGRQLAVIDCAEDLSGRFRLVRVLACDEATFRRTVRSGMRKKADGKAPT